MKKDTQGPSVGGQDESIPRSDAEDQAISSGADLWFSPATAPHQVTYWALGRLGPKEEETQGYLVQHTTGQSPFWWETCGGPQASWKLLNMH